MFKFFIVLLGLCAWLYYKYVSLIKIQRETFNAYNATNKELLKEYGILLELIIYARKNMPEQSGLLDYIDKLKTESNELEPNSEFINRKIAFDNELDNKASELIEKIEQSNKYLSDTGALALVKTYCSANNNVCAAREEYNRLAHKLRTVVDVFPTSFMARLKNIKSVDYMKTN